MEKQDPRDSLVECIEGELQKDADKIDGDLVDRAIDGLYALDGLSPPRPGAEDLEAALRAIRSRAAWRRGKTMKALDRKRRFTRRALHGVWAACCASLVLLSINFVSALATGSCLLSKVGIKFCCGTQFCRCEIAEAEAENFSRPE